MKTQPSSHRKSAGFTLVEMIGVLAVIAILASMLVPRVFQAISDSKVNSAAASVASMKAAAIDYYGKYGRFAAPKGTNATVAQLADWDSQVLLPEGLIEKRFTLRMGNGIAGGTNTPAGSHLAVVAVVAATAAGTGVSFDLDGDGTVDTLSGTMVEAIIPGVTAQDAIDFNERIDGTTLGAALNAADAKGRVTYIAPDGTTGVTTVYVYLAHK